MATAGKKEAYVNIMTIDVTMMLVKERVIIAEIEVVRVIGTLHW